MSRLYCDSVFFFPSPILLHCLRRRPTSDDDAFLALPRFFSPFPSPSSFVSFATSDDDASLPTLTPRREDWRGGGSAGESGPRRGTPRHASVTTTTPVSPPPQPPPPPSFAATAPPRLLLLRSRASPRLLLLRSRCLPRALSFPFAAVASPAPSFPFAAAASPRLLPLAAAASLMPSRGGGCGVAAHGNPAWAELLLTLGSKGRGREASASRASGASSSPPSTSRAVACWGSLTASSSFSRGAPPTAATRAASPTSLPHSVPHPRRREPRRVRSLRRPLLEPGASSSLAEFNTAAAKDAIAASISGEAGVVVGALNARRAAICC
uniref:Uncharacterized protein n=1 Tax=Ananas comosus var. bracteatus TaxID=296719 RepID=A0A6V7NED5_ANACO|nr:unnamed protein product [Ananas comosus var. bracteatus]